jgi:hypothetical protein
MLEKQIQKFSKNFALKHNGRFPSRLIICKKFKISPKQFSLLKYYRIRARANFYKINANLHKPVQSKEFIPSHISPSLSEIDLGLTF